MTWTYTRGLWGSPDLLHGDSTASATQLRQGNNGIESTTIQYLDSAVYHASTVAKNLFSLSGTKKLDDLFIAIAGGAGLQYASASQNGQVYRMSAAPAVAGQPTAMEQNDARIARIVSAAIYNALTGSAQTPDYGNAYVTRYETQLARSLSLGSGKDGHGKLGAIAASSTAPTITSTATAGLLTGTFQYKIAAYNLSGAIVASSASASTGALVAKQVRLTLPALPSGAMGWRIYRSTGGAYELVGTAVLGFNYTETASDARQYLYDDNNPTTNSAQTAPAADTTGNTATLSGLFQFITFTTTASTAITVASTGVTAGILDIRYQTTWTGASLGWSITGTGANAVNVGKFRLSLATASNGVSRFVALRYDDTIATSTVSAATTGSLAYGIGADASFCNQLLSGLGTKGSGTTGGDGGYGGALVRIWGYTTDTGTMGGTITVSGAAGTIGTTNGGGGGGGAAGLIDIGCLLPWADVGTRTAAGGVGGTGAGTGRGGGGGAGGAVIRRNCFSKSGATTSVAFGATGTNGGTTADGGYGGGHYGNGGLNVTATQTVATAGQQFDFNGLYDPSMIFAA